MQMFKAALAVSAVFALAGPAVAQSDAQSVAVSTSGLDLSSPEDRAILAARVGRAANKVCGAHDARGAAAFRSFQMCRLQAIRSAIGD